MSAFSLPCWERSISDTEFVLVTDAICSLMDETHDALLALYHQRFAEQIETIDTEMLLRH